MASQACTIGDSNSGHLDLVVVGTDGVAHIGLLAVLLGQLHAQDGVRQLGFLVGHLADVVQQAGALGGFGIQAQFGGHDGAEVGHLAAVLQQVLAVGAAVLHAAHHADELGMQSVDAQVDAGALARFDDLLLQVLLGLGHDLFDASRVDATILHQLVQGQACHFTANRRRSS
jgi:hypothetical protein